MEVTIYRAADLSFYTLKTLVKVEKLVEVEKFFLWFDSFLKIITIYIIIPIFHVFTVIQYKYKWNDL